MEIREIAISWVLYSIREAIGLSDVRNEILKKKIERLGTYPKNEIVYGKTFTQGDTFNDIHQMIYNFHGSDKRVLVFTSNGEIVQKRGKRKFDDDLIESHYVSFILDKRNAIAVIIDPSRNNGNVGIYNPYIGICLEPFFKKQGYTVKWLEMTSPCQINYHDVFCQSWTLFLVYKWLKYNDNEKIFIPKKQHKKYSKLLGFYKKLLEHSIFRDELRTSYYQNIEDHDDYRSLSEYDPCILLSEMTTEDMNPDEIKHKRTKNTKNTKLTKHVKFIDLSSVSSVSSVPLEQSLGS